MDYAINNALLQICRRVNKECQQVEQGDLKQITEILQRNYKRVSMLFPEISYSRFKYVLAKINRRVIERD